MNEFDDKAFMPLDEEEAALLASLENDEWYSVPDPEAEKENAAQAARHTIRKDKRINLRLTQRDYYEIQIRAIAEGVPYQTLIASLVHKYLDGSLVSRDG
jgi:predicted DNA binding CopG/RHH family protein